MKALSFSYMFCIQSSLSERFVVCALELSFRLPSGEIECEDSRRKVAFSRQEFFYMLNSNPLRLIVNADCQGRTRNLSAPGSLQLSDAVARFKIRQLQ